MNRISFPRIFFAVVTALLCRPGRAAIAEPSNYQRACEPGVKLALQQLPPGAVEPSLWLRDWAVAAREGVTGHLDEYHPVFRDGWKGTPIKSGTRRPRRHRLAVGAIGLLARRRHAAGLCLAR